MPIAVPLETMTTIDKLRAVEEIWVDLVRKSEADESESVPFPFGTPISCKPVSSA
uniref:Addiction module component n=1 Tax=Candidatus Kentrum sp. LFY TaxID=2126342 RepID=A0A450UG48_9GAMM|nr:MAG: hypothetical protein BECKLFY1418B_GA0070995_102619 [Candidatus Kentron sp. LFY]